MANEKRLIDANALLEEIKFRRPVIDTETKIVADCVEIARKAIVKAPTVDAVEVVHGHWYKAPHHPYRCSCCGEMALLDMYGESHYRSNYCPNCGAKMDGGNEDA